jgi:hypothetical protein
MLTTDLDDPGYGWNRSLPTTGASRSIRQLWSALDGRNLATDLMMALHARRWLAGSGFRVPGLAVCQLALPIGFAVLTIFIEELCGMLVHLGPQ